MPKDNQFLPIKNSIVQKYFWDYWWRKKYNVPFGSLQHRKMFLQDMLLEYLEEIEILKIELSEKQKQLKEENNLLGFSNDKTEKMTKKEVDELFDNLDLEQFDEK